MELIYKKEKKKKKKREKRERGTENLKEEETSSSIKSTGTGFVYAAKDILISPTR